MTVQAHACPLLRALGARRRPSWRTLLALASSLYLAGCGDVSERRAHLTVGTYWGGAAIQTLHRELIRIAQELGSVDIDVRPFSYPGLDDYLSKNQPREAQDTVDLAVVPSDWLGQLAQREIIGEVPSARVEAMRRKLVGQSLLAVSDGAQVLAFPISADVDALVFDPGVFPSSPRTIDDVLSATLPPGVIPFALDLADPVQLAPFVSALQGSLVDRGGHLLWRDQEVVETVRRLRPAWASPERWAACHGVDLESLQLQLFAEGKLASFVAGPWLLQALEEANRKRIKSLCFLGRDGGFTKGVATLDLLVPGTSTARIQEAQKLLFHVLCETVDLKLPK
jgi:ABC-type glycerol-3-phosphate transport system substrate-binding protein